MKKIVGVEYTRDMKDLFRWMNDHWEPSDLGPRKWWRKFSGKSKMFKKNQRKGL